MRHWRVLLVDDERAVVQAMARAFRQRAPDVEVALATTAEEALGRALLWNPDAVVADVLMPEHGASAVFTSVRSVPCLRHVRLFAVSAHLTPRLEDAMMAAGARHCFEKPLQPEQVVALLDEPPQAPSSETQKPHGEELAAELQLALESVGPLVLANEAGAVLWSNGAARRVCRVDELPRAAWQPQHFDGASFTVDELPGLRFRLRVLRPDSARRPTLLLSFDLAYRRRGDVLRSKGWSEKQIEIFEALKAGLTAKEAAMKLRTSLSTLKTHLERIRKRTQKSRFQEVAALVEGWMDEARDELEREIRQRLR